MIMRWILGCSFWDWFGGSCGFWCFWRFFWVWWLDYWSLLVKLCYLYWVFFLCWWVCLYDYCWCWLLGICGFWWVWLYCFWLCLDSCFFSWLELWWFMLVFWFCRSGKSWVLNWWEDVWCVWCLFVSGKWCWCWLVFVFLGYFLGVSCVEGCLDGLCWSVMNCYVVMG